MKFNPRPFILGLLLVILGFNPLSLWATTISTFYGELSVEEPLLLELIESPCFQRLKNIHQYGVAYYTSHKEEYSRYDHSLGVFAVLRLKGASLEEQVAGLLHDASHTAFSHVGDWIFGKNNQEKDYQNSIHEEFLQKYGLGAILMKYGLSPEQVLPLEHLFPMLENKSPSLCADRIEYNIQGAYHQNFLTHEEALEILSDLRYENGDWISSRPDLISKLGRFSLFMTETCWGSPHNHLVSTWLAEAILRGVELDLISFDQIHIGEDDSIWSLLCSSNDPMIQKCIHNIIFADDLFTLVDNPSDADIIVKSKFRGINPLIATPEGNKRLTEIDSDYQRDFMNCKTKMEQGWRIKYLSPNLVGCHI